MPIRGSAADELLARVRDRLDASAGVSRATGLASAAAAWLPIEAHGQLGDAAPSESTARIQESHISVCHVLCELVESELFPESVTP